MATTPRGQMLDQALQRIGNNSGSLRIQARYRMNRVLQDLQRGYDWPYLWTASPVSILPNGTVAMPANFVKPEDDQSLSYTTSSNSHVTMQEVDHKTFDQRITGTSPFGNPRLWTMNYTFLVGTVWPRPDTTLPALMRHKFLPPDQPINGQLIDNLYDLDVPLFPFDSFLTDMIAEWGMAYEVDPRRAEQLSINDELLRRIRGATYPERSFPSTVQLDPLFFSTPSWGSGRDS